MLILSFKYTMYVDVLYVGDRIKYLIYCILSKYNYTDYGVIKSSLSSETMFPFSIWGCPLTNEDVSDVCLLCKQNTTLVHLW